MARYGYDFDSRYSGWRGGGRSGAGFSPGRAPGGYGGHGGYDAGFRGGAWGGGGWSGAAAGWQGMGDPYADGYWSTTEYGVYLGPGDQGPRGYDAGLRDARFGAGGGAIGYETGGWDGYGGAYDGWGWERAGGWSDRGDAAEVRVGDIMTENPETVTPDTSLADVARLMRDLSVGIIPVVEDAESGRLRGVITDRDITVRAAAEGKDMKKTTVSEAMTERVETVMASHHVRDVFDVMKREQVRRVPVTDRDGRLVGIVAQADLAIDYAGLDQEREAEVEEVIERISEPGRPQWGRPRRMMAGPRGYERDFGDRIRHGWQTLRREARGLLGGRGYDEGWR